MGKGMAALLVTAALIVTVDARPTNDLPIVGAWTLNHDLSTKPADRTDDREGPRAGGGQRGRFGGGAGGGGFGGRGGGGGMRPPSDEQRLRIQAVMRRLREAPERLTITNDGQTVAFADGDGRTWKVTTDGKKQKLLTGEGELEVKGSLDGANLVVEEKFNGGAKLIYTYAPTEDAGTHRLSVKVKLDGASDNGPRHLPEMTRIYDALDQ